MIGATNIANGSSSLKGMLSPQRHWPNSLQIIQTEQDIVYAYSAQSAERRDTPTAAVLLNHPRCVCDTSYKSYWVVEWLYTTPTPNKKTSSHTIYDMSHIWAPAAEPKTKLGRHRQLAPLAGVHVSPIQLGAMSIGDKWHPYGMGAMDKDSSFKLLDAFYDAGGNFIDTANN
jgi:hypothetical protein